MSVYTVREVRVTALGDRVHASIPCADRDYAEYKAQQLRHRNIKHDIAEDTYRIEIIEPSI